MKQKYYDRADGKLYKCVFCDSCRTEMPERLNIYEFSAKIIAILVYNG